MVRIASPRDQGITIRTHRFPGNVAKMPQKRFTMFNSLEKVSRLVSESDTGPKSFQSLNGLAQASDYWYVYRLPQFPITPPPVMARGASENSSFGCVSGRHPAQIGGVNGAALRQTPFGPTGMS
ncbi:hypothetical protein [Roseomonas genomospecies 6]|uniref:hypothetical protein n=1 Tax=Roseomonas genomospecies 6 TaxID=214106 RepID=UPI0011F3407D|nr:hypothetical protein [Roseomonas genomospecies 6]